MIRLNHTRTGSGPLLVLSHALGCDLSMWDAVVPHLENEFTVLRYDHRCHGKSECPSGPFSVDDMADDIAALLQQENAGPVIFAGLSLGGMVAQSLAARHPQLVKAIIIANSAAYYEEVSRGIWEQRIASVTQNGMSAVVEGSLARWFTPEFVNSAEGRAPVEATRQVLQSCDPTGYIASCQAVSAIDFRASNARIACPALIIAGSKDMATPVALSEAMQAQIPHARLTTIEGAHLSAVEQPQAFARLMKDFIKTLG